LTIAFSCAADWMLIALLALLSADEIPAAV
jgi:hypothetical protein